MKNKLFYFIALPLAWLTIAIITANSYADKAWLLSVAPAVWITLFKDANSITFYEFISGGLVGIVIVCFILSKFEIKPRLILISSLAMSFILWVALCIFASKGSLVKNPISVFVWFLCCFNFSLCLLSPLILPVKMCAKYINKR